MELAENLDVSHQALSERLRRGQKELAENQISADSKPNSQRVSE